MSFFDVHKSLTLDSSNADQNRCCSSRANFSSESQKTSREVALKRQSHVSLLRTEDT
jgi:hypothetical protein